MRTNWATLDATDGKPVLRLERRLAHPPEKVWRAISDPAEMVHWFPAKVETELAVGAEMRFTFEGEDATTSGEILEMDPPKLFVYRWQTDVLRFELVPDGAGCHLYFTHIVSEALGGRQAAGRNAAGWDTCLDALAGRLDGTAPATGPDDMLALMEGYAERFGLAEGEVRRTEDGYLLRFERDLVWRPMSAVWALIGGDVGPGDQPPVGATNGYVPAGGVTEVESERLLAYRWLHDGAPAGEIRWELDADPEAGHRVVLTQTVPAELAGLRATALAAWQTQIEVLFRALMGGETCPWPTERTEELVRRYTERLG
ncbi:SRPBCC family protein [Amycolatopsis nigrescens]|uniref:SRPBCC family protein n=1 Tax=Amycolatopsis nigrescens TaxID=381445 RepID=UPI00146B4B9A|nr:SRPBCC family protein [Amycolatopsis nigrescens]